MSDLDHTAIAETPLHYYHGKRVGAPNAKMMISEVVLKKHLIIRGSADDTPFISGIKTVLGVNLPLTPCTYNSDHNNAIFWLGPTEWLAVISDTADNMLENTLRKTLGGYSAVVDVSGGQTLINLSGAGVETVLKKSSGFDFQSPTFKHGHCAQTTFAKASALVSKRLDGSFDLIIRRSFTDYLASWLLDASTEFGCQIK